MSANDLERLLWERIDGTIEAADAARLAELLASEPGAERLEAKVAYLASELDSTAETPIPADLGDGIHRALRAARDSSKATSGPWYAGLRRLAGPRPARRLVYLAAVLAISAVGYQLVSAPAERDAGSFVGTAGLTDPESVTSTVRLELSGARGLLTISPRVGGFGVELETSPTLGRCRLVIAGAGLEVERAGQEGGAVLAIQAGERGLEVEITGSGAIELLVAAGGEGGEIAISVEAEGETLAAHNLEMKTDKSQATNF